MSTSQTADHEAATATSTNEPDGRRSPFKLQPPPAAAAAAGGSVLAVTPADSVTTTQQISSLRQASSTAACDAGSQSPAAAPAAAVTAAPATAHRTPSTGAHRAASPLHQPAGPADRSRPAGQSPSASTGSDGQSPTVRPAAEEGDGSAADFGVGSTVLTRDAQRDEFEIHTVGRLTKRGDKVSRT